MKTLCLSFICLVSTTVLCQNSTNQSTIKISVDTPVEVGVEKITLSISLEVSEEYRYYEEEIREVEKVLEEKGQELDEEISAQIENELDQYKPKYVKDLVKELDALGITKRIQIGDGEMSEYYSDVSDTVIYATVYNSKEMNSINDLMERYPCEVDLEETVYESEEQYDAETYPILVEKATTKAKIIAKALDKKVVGIQECSNVYPLSMRPKFYEDLADLDFRLGNSYVSNAFDQTKTYYPSLIFTFVVE
ncbi:MAG: hypothetical protein ACFHU9_02485 [Fluviicola sp.]